MAEVSSASLSPARDGLKHADVAAQLREMILTGDLAAGARLNERVLCESLRVSRTPLREAFRVLAAERLVALHPNRGASVVELSAQDIRDLFEVMIGLEGLSGELAASRASDEQIDEVRALHYEMLAAHARRDLPAYYRLNRDIHEAINRAAGNLALAETYDAINIRIQHLRFRSNFNQAKWDAAVAEHSQMIEALAARDASTLRSVLETHLIHKRDTVLAALTSTGEHLLKEIKR
ncbi:MAG: GntR family transcriptional regulator [Burkholderiaceae bacterium]